MTRSSTLGSDSEFLDDNYELTVPQPVISPAGGSFTEAVTVEIALSSSMDDVVFYYNTMSSISNAPYYSASLPWAGSVNSGTFYVPREPPILTENGDINARAFRPGWLQSDANHEDYEITTTIVDVDLIQRLVLGIEFTSLNFDGEEIYLIFTIATEGSYYLRWSDSKEGDGTDTVDIEVRLYNADPVSGGPDLSINLIPSQEGFSGYYGPLSILFTPGDYFLRLVFESGSATTGTAKILISE